MPLTLSRFARAQYAAGSFGTGVYATVPSVLLLFFCTNVLGIGSGTAAAIVLVPKLWSIAWDPLVGRWSDGIVTRYGRRAPYIAAGAVGVAASFFALFSPPAAAGPLLAVWTGGAYFLLTSFYSLFAVPYLAVPAEIDVAEEDRARLVSWRIAAAMAGVLAGSAIAPFLIELAGGGRPGYRVMAAVLAFACVLAMLTPLAMVGRATSGNSARATDGRDPKSFLGLLSRRFVCLVLAYVALLAGLGVISAAIPYLVTVRFARSEGSIGIALGIMLATTIVSVPLWSRAAFALGVLRALGWSLILLAMLGLCLWPVVRQLGSWPGFLGLMCGLGAVFAGLQVLPYTAATDMIHELAGADGSEASLMGIWTAAEKIGLALGPAAFGAMMALAHSNGADAFAVAFIAGGCFLLALLALLLLQPIASRPRE